MKKIAMLAGVGLLAMSSVACAAPHGHGHGHHHSSLMERPINQAQDAMGVSLDHQTAYPSDDEDAAMAAARALDRAQERAKTKEMPGHFGITCSEPLPVDATNSERDWVDRNCD